MLLWQNGTKKHTKQRGSENAGEGDKQDYDGIHDWSSLRR
jgi:hypothetical protein